MLGYSKILCAIDFDEYAIATLRVAAALAKESNALLYILHVTRIPSRDMDVPLPIEANPIWEKVARGRLEELIEQCPLADLGYETRIVSGLPDLDIVRTAKELAVDLIVMATHGRSGLTHLLLSSVAEHVIREAACPILILRPPLKGGTTTSPTS
ncbi:MAG TPA: universal stress protein [Candidatus Binataceae bacterium]|nr:universal stress protein [Candidatus Binataceae bacterium]